VRDAYGGGVVELMWMVLVPLSLDRKRRRHWSHWDWILMQPRLSSVEWRRSLARKLWVDLCVSLRLLML